MNYFFEKSTKRATLQITQRGIPERINQSSLGAMMARDPCTTPSCCCCCCCCLRGVACRPLPVGKDEQDLGQKTRGGRSPRGRGEGVSPSNGGRVLVHTCLQDALFLHEIASVSSYFDKICSGKKSPSRRICCQSLGRIREK